jgi:hypothetical protein
MTSEIHELIKHEARKIVQTINRQENAFIKNTVFPKLFDKIPTRAELRKIEKFPSAQDPNNTHIRLKGEWLGTICPKVLEEGIYFVFYPTPQQNTVLIKGRATGRKFEVKNLMEMAQQTTHEN